MDLKIYQHRVLDETEKFLAAIAAQRAHAGGATPATPHSMPGATSTSLTSPKIVPPSSPTT